MRFFALLFAMLCLAAYVAAEAPPVHSDNWDDDGAVCACPRILDPVCGSDAITYPNSCEFECAQKRMSRMGRSLLLANKGLCERLADDVEAFVPEHHAETL